MIITSLFDTITLLSIYLVYATLLHCYVFALPCDYIVLRIC
nr:MAG TPA: hypothetical protein [Caudoviricetes sp.]